MDEKQRRLSAYLCRTADINFIEIPRERAHYADSFLSEICFCCRRCEGSFSSAISSDSPASRIVGKYVQ